MAVEPVKLDIYHVRVPMRTFEHAAASRSLTDAVVVRLVLSDGRQGWGETHPRPYVTGESVQTVAADLREIIWPAIGSGFPRFRDFWPDVDGIIPARSPDGRCMNAAACAAELALLAAGELPAGLFGAGPSAGRASKARVTGVIGSADPAGTARSLRLMRLYGLRDFKLKLGMGEDADRRNLQAAQKLLAGGVAKGRLTLRVDVNGGWDEDSTPRRVAELRRYGVCAVEQPTACSAKRLAELSRRCELPLVADESLLDHGDAESLLAAGASVWWNLRISKNGGVGRCVKLARMARSNGVPFIVGCMVGEFGLLSMAQRLLLTQIDGPKFIEGNYGRFLLADDITTRSPRFGYGGWLRFRLRLRLRLKRLRREGGLMDVRVDPRKLAKYGRLIDSVEA